jgi:hypothetical protein
MKLQCGDFRLSCTIASMHSPSASTPITIVNGLSLRACN